MAKQAKACLQGRSRNRDQLVCLLASASTIEAKADVANQQPKPSGVSLKGS